MKNKSTLAMAIFASMLHGQENFEPTNRTNFERKVIPEPIPQKGQFHYWFREDGTFINEKQSERMLREECVFKCYSINDKNAIKKFNKFKKQL